MCTVDIPQPFREDGEKTSTADIKETELSSVANRAGFSVPEMRVEKKVLSAQERWSPGQAHSVSGGPGMIILRQVCWTGTVVTKGIDSNPSTWLRFGRGRYFPLISVWVRRDEVFQFMWFHLLIIIRGQKIIHSSGGLRCIISVNCTIIKTDRPVNLL